MESKIIATPINDEETVLSLPIKKKQLGEFISSLLGQQQSIERHRYVDFDIDHVWLMNLHEMISQRIHQQAEAYLTSFSVVIYFEGGLKRTLTSVEAFATYLENKNSLPVGIKIIWIFLIKFPSKEYPEKQQITFSARINTQKRTRTPIIFFGLLPYEPEKGEINYQIDHTERTWGDDIESILHNQVAQVNRNSYLQSKLYSCMRIISVLSIAIILISFLWKSTSNLKSEVYSNFISSNSNSFTEINRKINLLADILINRVHDLDEKVVILPLLLSVFVVIFILLITKNNNYSFLVLSKEAEKYREKKMQRERRNILILIGSFAVSVLSGIIGNYGFAWLTK